MYVDFMRKTAYLNVWPTIFFMVTGPTKPPSETPGPTPPQIEGAKTP